MRFCGTCGNEVADEQGRFCTVCGSGLDAQGAAKSTRAAPAQTEVKRGPMPDPSPPGMGEPGVRPTPSLLAPILFGFVGAWWAARRAARYGRDTRPYWRAATISAGVYIALVVAALAAALVIAPRLLRTLPPGVKEGTACSIAPLEDLGEAIGRPVLLSARNEWGAEEQCFYSEVKDTADYTEVSLIVSTWPDHASGIRDQWQSDPASRIPDLGDYALRSAPNESAQGGCVYFVRDEKDLYEICAIYPYSSEAVRRAAEVVDKSL